MSYESILQRVIRRNFSEYGKIAVSIGGNIGGSVIMHEVCEALKIPATFITLDTGKLFPETYPFFERCEKRYGITIKKIPPDPEEVAELIKDKPEDFFLENYVPCCDVRKVRPLAKELREGGYDAWMTGIMRDPKDKNRRSVSYIERDAQHEGIAKLNPLAFWDPEMAMQFVRDHDIPYHPLLDLYDHLACEKCTQLHTVRNGHRECGLHYRHSKLVSIHS